MIDNYTRLLLTVIAIGIVALNIKLWGGPVSAGLVTPAHADGVQQVRIVGPTTTLGYLKVKMM